MNVLLLLLLYLGWSEATTNTTSLKTAETGNTDAKSPVALAQVFRRQDGGNHGAGGYGGGHPPGGLGGIDLGALSGLAGVLGQYFRGAPVNHEGGGLTNNIAHNQGSHGDGYGSGQQSLGPVPYRNQGLPYAGAGVRQNYGGFRPSAGQGYNVPQYGYGTRDLGDGYNNLEGNYDGRFVNQPGYGRPQYYGGDYGFNPIDEGQRYRVQNYDQGYGGYPSGEYGRGYPVRGQGGYPAYGQEGRGSYGDYGGTTQHATRNAGHSGSNVDYGQDSQQGNTGEENYRNSDAEANDQQLHSNRDSSASRNENHDATHDSNYERNRE